MSWKTPLILLVILLLTASYFFFVEQRGAEEQKAEEKLSRRILPYGIAEVTRVVFTNPEGDRIEWVRDGDGWTIVYPTVTPGSRSTIDYFISEMIPGAKRNEFDPDKGLSAYGLSPPLSTVVFFTKSRTDTLYVGESTPLSSQCYVMRSGYGKIMVARDLTRNLVRKNLYHLRDKSLMQIKADSVEAIRVSVPGKSFTFDRQPGTWMIRGTRLGADRSIVTPYITALTGAIIREFAAEDTSNAESFGFGDPGRMITLFTAEDSLTIEFGSPDGEFVSVIRSGLPKVLRIEKKFEQVFDWLSEDIMVLNVAYFVPSEVSSITWETGTGSRSVERDGEHWRTGDGSAVEDSKIRYFLILLRSLIFDRIGESASAADGAELGDDAYRVTLRNPEGSVLDEITLARSRDGGIKAWSLSSGSTGTVRDEGIEEIVRTFERLYGGVSSSVD